MSIRKPVDTTIHADDLGDKAYCFTVEAVLGSVRRAGVVVVSASAGYLLTTSQTNQPKREQLISYQQQADGSWMASDEVTLLMTGDSPVNGAVVIRDSAAEVVVLTVDVTATTRMPLQLPALTVSQPTLTFAGASPGKPSFQVLSVAQQHSDAPVTLTTDAPDCFQLASDSHPAFAPSLTLTPSPVGTYVHVRYNGSKHRRHTGQLTIRSVYGNETVALEARSAPLLPAVLSSRNRPAPKSRWAGLLAPILIGVPILIGGLAYTGYTYRCQLFPALCQTITTSQTANRESAAAPANGSDAISKKETVVLNRERIPQPVARPVESPARPVPGRISADRSANQPIPGGTNEPSTVTSSSSVARKAGGRRTPTDQAIDNAADKPLRRPATPAAPAEESDLERELNQPVNNQLN